MQRVLKKSIVRYLPKIKMFFFHATYITPIFLLLSFTVLSFTNNDEIIRTTQISRLIGPYTLQVNTTVGRLILRANNVETCEEDNKMGVESAIDLIANSKRMRFRHTSTKDTILYGEIYLDGTDLAKYLKKLNLAFNQGEKPCEK